MEAIVLIRVDWLLNKFVFCSWQADLKKSGFKCSKIVIEWKNWLIIKS